MDEGQLRELENAIQSLRQKHAALVREAADSEPLCTAWTVAGSWLRWQVELEEVLEPDLDVEILPEMLVVRALRGAGSDKLAVALLPIPRWFDAIRPVIRVRDTILEIRVFRRERTG